MNTFDQSMYECMKIIPIISSSRVRSNRGVSTQVSKGTKLFVSCLCDVDAVDICSSMDIIVEEPAERNIIGNKYTYKLLAK